MSFVVASVAQEGNSALLKPWYGVSIDHNMSLSEFYAEFSDGKFDREPIPESSRRSIVKVLAGEYALFHSHLHISIVHMDLVHDVSCDESIGEALMGPMIDDFVATIPVLKYSYVHESRSRDGFLAI